MKVVQLACTSGDLYALCDNGRIYQRVGGQWKDIPSPIFEQEHDGLCAATPTATATLTNHEDDFMAFNRKYSRIFMARTGERGEKSDWRDLLRTHGSERTGWAVRQVHKAKGDKPIYYNDVVFVINNALMAERKAAKQAGENPDA